MAVPTYSQLAAEPYWNAEFAPPNLDLFYRRLRSFYGLGAQYIGGKGDNNHLRGYHRSRAWILNSAYSKYGTADYSIQQELDKGGLDDWLAALDMTVPASKLYAACRRVDAAIKAGALPQIREYYGTFDGRTVVGYDQAKGQPATSDASHLYHLHLSFYRSMADNDHTLLYQIITGTGGGYGMAIKDTVVLAPGNTNVTNTMEYQTILLARGHDLGTSGPNHDGVDGGFGTRTTNATKAEQVLAATAFPDAGFVQTGSLDVKLWDFLTPNLDATPPSPNPDPPLDKTALVQAVAELDTALVAVDAALEVADTKFVAVQTEVDAL